VGFILRRSGLAKGVVPEVPVDYADADTQGAIGYMFQRALYNEFRRRGLPHKVVTVITQVLAFFVPADSDVQFDGDIGKLGRLGIAPPANTRRGAHSGSATGLAGLIATGTGTA